MGTLRGRLAALHGNHKRIAAGALLIGILTLVAKLFVAARDIVIAWRFGVGGTADAYQLALTITTWLPTMLTGVMAVVLVPPLVELRQRVDEYSQFIAELNGTVLVIGIAVSSFIFLLAPAASRLLASSGNPAMAGLTSAIAEPLAPVALFLIAVGYLSARLQANERFAYSLTEAVPAATIAAVTGALVGGPVESLIIGTLAGFFLQLCILLALVEGVGGSLGTIRLKHRSPAWRPVYSALALMSLGQMLIMASLPIDQAFAARIGEGSVAALGYANRIVALLSGVGTVIVGRALLPVLSDAVARNEAGLARRQAVQWAVLLLAAGTAGAAVIWILAPEVVRLLFERGAFGAGASNEVTRALRFGLLQIPPYFAGIALVQWYAARRRFGAIFLITAAALLVKIAFNAMLMPIFGIGGILAATALMYTLTSSLLFLGARRDLGMVPLPPPQTSRYPDG